MTPRHPFLIFKIQMKKALLLVAGFVCSMAAWATNYTGQLIVTVNGNLTQMGTTIALDQNGDKYNFSLKNFKLVNGEQVIGVGNIELNDLEAAEAYSIKTITVEKDIMITEGDDPTIDQWIGPVISPIPLKLVAKFNDQVLSVDIDINMVTLGQIIKVNFVGNTPSTPSIPTGDVNGDGKINVSDVSALINIILGIH